MNDSGGRCYSDHNEDIRTKGSCDYCRGTDLITHDPLCWKTGWPQPEHDGDCFGILRKARADERKRIVAELEGPARESEAMYAHAEDAAAKLVEVICDDAAVMEWDLRALEATARERDAARARTVEMEQKAIDAQRDAALARAEVAALRESHRAALRDIAALEKTLADLRAKVKGLPTWDGYYEPVVTLREVLALIKEVGQRD